MISGGLSDPTAAAITISTLQQPFRCQSQFLVVESRPGTTSIALPEAFSGKNMLWYSMYFGSALGNEPFRAYFGFNRLRVGTEEWTENTHRRWFLTQIILPAIKATVGEVSNGISTSDTILANLEKLQKDIEESGSIPAGRDVFVPSLPVFLFTMTSALFSSVCDTGCDIVLWESYNMKQRFGFSFPIPNTAMFDSTLTAEQRKHEIFGSESVADSMECLETAMAASAFFNFAFNLGEYFDKEGHTGAATVPLSTNWDLGIGLQVDSSPMTLRRDEPAESSATDHHTMATTPTESPPASSPPDHGATTSPAPSAASVTASASAATTSGATISATSSVPVDHPTPTPAAVGRESCHVFPFISFSHGQQGSVDADLDDAIEEEEGRRQERAVTQETHGQVLDAEVDEMPLDELDDELGMQPTTSEYFASFEKGIGSKLQIQRYKNLEHYCIGGLPTEISPFTASVPGTSANSYTEFNLQSTAQQSGDSVQDSLDAKISVRRTREQYYQPSFRHCSDAETAAVTRPTRLIGSCLNNRRGVGKNVRLEFEKTETYIGHLEAGLDTFFEQNWVGDNQLIPSVAMPSARFEQTFSFRSFPRPRTGAAGPVSPFVQFFGQLLVWATSTFARRVEIRDGHPIWTLVKLTAAVHLHLIKIAVGEIKKISRNPDLSNRENELPGLLRAARRSAEVICRIYSGSGFYRSGLQFVRLLLAAGRVGTTLGILPHALKVVIENESREWRKRIVEQEQARLFGMIGDSPSVGGSRVYHELAEQAPSQINAGGGQVQVELDERGMVAVSAYLRHAETRRAKQLDDYRDGGQFCGHTGCNERFESLNELNLHMRAQNHASMPGDGDVHLREALMREVRGYIDPPSFTDKGVNFSVQQRKIVTSIIESGKNYLVLGPGGTGKSVIATRSMHSLKKVFRSRARGSGMTGAAAQRLEIDGMVGVTTFHGALHITPALAAKLDLIELKKHWSSNEETLNSICTLEVVFVDEVSMLSAQLLELVDSALRDVRGSNLPFGSVQFVFFGDFLQLLAFGQDIAGVRQCFESQLIFRFFEIVELQQNFRQTQEGDGENQYRMMLANLRVSGYFDVIHYDKLSKYYQFGNEVRRLLSSEDPRDQLGVTYLFASKREADDQNRLSLESFVQRSTQRGQQSDRSQGIHAARRSGPSGVGGSAMAGERGAAASSSTSGSELRRILTKESPLEIVYMRYRAKEGNVNSSKTIFSPGCDTLHANIAVAVGVPIMTLTNRPDIGYMNGTIGVVEELDVVGTTVTAIKIRICMTANNPGKLVTVEQVAAEIEGLGRSVYIQWPLRLCFASTVHKAQGHELRAVVIRSFRTMGKPGQLYTALSRVKSCSAIMVHLGDNLRKGDVLQGLHCPKALAFMSGISGMAKERKEFIRLQNVSIVRRYTDIEAIPLRPPTKIVRKNKKKMPVEKGSQGKGAKRKLGEE